MSCLDSRNTSCQDTTILAPMQLDFDFITAAFPGAPVSPVCYFILPYLPHSSHNFEMPYYLALEALALNHNPVFSSATQCYVPGYGAGTAIHDLGFPLSPSIDTNIFTAIQTSNPGHLVEPLNAFETGQEDLAGNTRHAVRTDISREQECNASRKGSPAQLW